MTQTKTPHKSMQMIIHAASLTHLVPVYWRPMVRFLLQNQVSRIFVPNSFSPDLLREAKDSVLKLAPHLNGDGFLLNGDCVGLLKEEDVLIDFVPYARGSGELNGIKCRKCLAVGADRGVFGEGLSYFRELGVAVILTDCLPDELPDGLSKELREYFFEHAFYLAPLVEEELLRIEKKRQEGSGLREGVLLVYDSSVVEVNEEKPFRHRLMNAVELLRRSLDVEVLDMVSVQFDINWSTAEVFGRRRWCILDLVDGSKQYWAMVQAIESGMDLMHWNKPRVSLMRSGLSGLGRVDGYEDLPDEQGTLRAHVHPLLMAIKNERVSKSSEWILDEGLYEQSNVHFNTEKRWQGLRDRLLKRGELSIDSNKKVYKAGNFWDILTDNFYKIQLPAILEVELTVWGNLPQVEREFGLRASRRDVVRKMLYLMGEYVRGGGELSLGLKHVLRGLLSELHCDQIGGLAKPLCMSLVGAQAEYYPEYIETFPVALQKVFVDLRINKEGIEPIMNNFVSGLLKYEAEKFGEPKGDEPIVNQYWLGHNKRYLEGVSRAGGGLRMKEIIRRIYKAKIPLVHAGGMMASVHDAILWELYDSEKVHLHQKKVSEMMELLELDIEYGRHYGHAIPQYVQCGFSIGLRERVLGVLESQKGKMSAYVCAQNAFIMWVLGFEKEARVAIDLGGHEVMTGGDELVLQACTLLFLGFVDEAREAFQRVKVDCWDIFHEGQPMMVWNQWFILSMAYGCVGDEGRAVYLDKMAQACGDAHYGFRQPWAKRASLVKIKTSEPVIPELSYSDSVVVGAKYSKNPF